MYLSPVIVFSPAFFSFWLLIFPSFGRPPVINGFGKLDSCITFSFPFCYFLEAFPLSPFYVILPGVSWAITLMTIVSWFGSKLTNFIKLPSVNLYTFHLSKCWSMCFPKPGHIFYTTLPLITIFITNLLNFTHPTISPPLTKWNPHSLLRPKPHRHSLTPFVRTEYLRRPGHSPLLPPRTEYLLHRRSVSTFGGSFPSPSSSPLPLLPSQSSPPRSPSHGSRGVTPGQLRKVY